MFNSIILDLDKNILVECRLTKNEGLAYNYKDKCSFYPGRAGESMNVLKAILFYDLFYWFWSNESVEV